jgi:hypothetical protein
MSLLPVDFRSKFGRRRSIGLAGIFLLLAGVVLPANADEQQTIVRQIQVVIAAADSPIDVPEDAVIPTASKGFAALFKGAGREEISALQGNPDNSIALQAAWRDVAATVPAEESRVAVHPDRDKLVWFLGFLEGRAHVKAPEWWAKFLVDSRAQSRDKIHPGYPRDAWLNYHHKTGMDFVFTPRDTSLKREADKVVLEVGPQSARLPATVFTEDLDVRVEAVSGLITRDRCYLVIHGNTGHPHPLYCIDRSTGKTNWKAKVWGNWWGIVAGHPRAWASLVEGDGNVIAFEASSGMNVEAFRIADGKPAFRFATSY